MVRRSHAWIIGVFVSVVCLFGGCGVGTAIGSSGSDPVSEAAASTPSATATDPTGAASQPPTEDPATEAPVTHAPKHVHYKDISKRQWKKIARDPDAHVGDAIIVYGDVTQFDSATGRDTFLADVGGDYDSCAYGFCDSYETNTLLTGKPHRMGKVVEDDTFRVKVRVLGSMDYDTQIGGQTTVPLLQVDHLKRLGNV